MFPNPQDALPLPPQSDLEQYKKLAKDLVQACKAPDAGAVTTWAERWVRALVRLTELELDSNMPVDIERWIGGVESFARAKLVPNGSLADAQFVIARSHGFESWPKFARHLTEIGRTRSGISNFETAVDAIVSGGLNALESLLNADRALVCARSTREHRATLLHYVSANGVEGYRQRTPGNIVQTAKLLLDSGAEVDAEADVYGGGATTLYLTATGIHPERANVQEELMELLIDHGAAINRPGQSVVIECLANGRRCTAEFLAARGADLDLEAAAGVGNLEVVRACFTDSGHLRLPSTKRQLDRGFLWACEYGRDAVIEFLLTRGADLQAQADTGQSPLHWAVVGGQIDTIKLLLRHGASLEVKNAYDGTALGQALWSAVNSNDDTDRLQVVETLLDAGARIEDGTLGWLAQQKRGSSLLKEQLAALLRRHGAKTRVPFPESTRIL